MGRGLRVLGVLLAAERAAGLSLHAEQPELFLPTKAPSLADPECPFYEKCGEDCLGSPLMRKQMSTEVKQLLQSLDSDHKVMAAFSLLSDLSADVAMACKFGLTVHVFDPRPLAPKHMEYLHQMVGTMGTPHPFLAPEHEPCVEGCSNYWDEVSHSKVGAEHFILHPLAVHIENSSIALHESLGGNYIVDPNKGIAGGNNVTVPTVSVLSALRAAGLSKVDVVRIDSDGMEHTILEQVASLPEEMRPELIFAQLPSFHEWVCRGEIAECKVWKKQAKAVVNKVQTLGYTMQLYHKVDFLFRKKHDA